MRLRPVLSGIASFVPGLLAATRGTLRGTDSARYCYAVWMRHLINVRRTTGAGHPRVVAELGPGGSLGVGVAALASGSGRYMAFDLVAHASVRTTAAVFDEIVALLRSRAPIPTQDEFPEIKPHLSSYAFPDDLFPGAALDAALADERLARIRADLDRIGMPGSTISYRVPWHDRSVVEPGSVDLIFSQAVLEHVDDLLGAYGAMRDWLRPDGAVSHQIDFRCHGIADEWNGHWAIGAPLWWLVRGRRPYYVNRRVCSEHKALIERNGLRIVREELVHAGPGIGRVRLARSMRWISDADLETSGAYFVATRAEGSARG